jgi:hypothetical protein
MQSFLRPTTIGPLSSLGRIRHYTASRISFQPTALHRAEEASDLKQHPESGVTQEKRKDVKHNHHWVEEDATTSEADVSMYVRGAKGEKKGVLFLEGRGLTPLCSVRSKPIAMVSPKNWGARKSRKK